MEIISTILNFSVTCNISIYYLLSCWYRKLTVQALDNFHYLPYDNEQSELNSITIRYESALAVRYIYECVGVCVALCTQGECTQFCSYNLRCFSLSESGYHSKLLAIIADVVFVCVCQRTHTKNTNGRTHSQPTVQAAWVRSVIDAFPNKAILRYKSCCSQVFLVIIVLFQRAYQVF